MPFMIEGSEGNGIVKVTKDQQLSTFAVISSDMQTQNGKGEAWSMPFDAVDPTGADDIFLYIKNTDATKHLHIRRVRASSSVAGMLEVIRVTGTAAGGTDATLVNFNGQFVSQTPEGSFQTGANITGLTDEGKYAFQQLKNTDQSYDVFIPHDIILTKNDAVALNWVPATGALSGTIWFYTEDVS